MAEVVLFPDPRSFPPGTTVTVKESALPERGGQLTGEPAGATVASPVVAASGSLTVVGVAEGRRYVGWAHVGGVDRYLFFSVEVAAAAGGESSSSDATRRTYTVGGAPGAVAGARWAGATATGHPTEGTYGVGDFVLARDGHVWVCTVAGTPGTWVDAGGGGAGGALLAANNLSDLANAVTARTNLGLGSSATHPATDFLAAASNLSDVANAATARGNLAAAPLASPALTGTPTAPTAAALTNSTQLATTAYADAAVSAQGALALLKANNLSDVASPATSRENLRVPALTAAACVATANVATLEGLLTIDGVTLEAGQIVLLTAQTEGQNNGPWVAAVGGWTRPGDFSTGFVLKASRMVGVLKGNVNKGTIWQLTTTAEVTIGTTAHAWEKTATGGGASSLEWHAVEGVNASLEQTRAIEYAVLSGLCHLRGLGKVTAEIAAKGTLFTIPVAGRPAAERNILMGGALAGTANSLAITTAGVCSNQVVLAAAKVPLFDGLAFPL